MNGKESPMLSDENLFVRDEDNTYVLCLTPGGEVMGGEVMKGSKGKNIYQLFLLF